MGSPGSGPCEGAGAARGPEAQVREGGAETRGSEAPDREGAGAARGSEAGARSFRLVLEYAGAGFEGWQEQAGSRPARTVQGVLVEALRSLTGGVPRVRGAGRTDAGVHAIGQVASVRVETGLAPDVLLRALNARLPADLVVREVAEVPDGWDALRAARAKHYRYQIWNGRIRSPLRTDRWAFVAEPLAVDAMARAARVFVGRHDFAALQGAGSSARTTVRTLTRLDVRGEAGGEIVLEVEGEGFLRHMVRNLAGTLIEIGRGRWAPERAAEILASRDRGLAGPTAPAHGLVLVAVGDGWEAGGEGGGEGGGAPGGAGGGTHADSPGRDEPGAAPAPAREAPDSIDGRGPVG